MASIKVIYIESSFLENNEICTLLNARSLEGVQIRLIHTEKKLNFNFNFKCSVLPKNPTKPPQGFEAKDCLVIMKNPENVYNDLNGATFFTTEACAITHLRKKKFNKLAQEKPMIPDTAKPQHELDLERWLAPLQTVHDQLLNKSKKPGGILQAAFDISSDLQIQINKLKNDFSDLPQILAEVKGAHNKLTNELKDYKQSDWYKVPRVVRGFLGVLSVLLLVIPALIVKYKSEGGFTQTFFGEKPSAVLERADEALKQAMADLAVNVDDEADADAQKGLI